MDDEVKGAIVEFPLAAGKIFNKRVEESSVLYNEILSSAFDFTVNEEVLLDADQVGFTVNATEQKERWRKKLKFMTLERYADLLESREKNKGKEGFVVKTDEELEKDARERVKKSWTELLNVTVSNSMMMINSICM